jgi:reductive dehalogenase
MVSIRTLIIDGSESQVSIGNILFQITQQRSYSMCACKISQPKYEIVGQLERFDEADNVQARGELIPDGQLWKEYFRKHPELEKVSREWSKLAGPGGVGPIMDRLMIGSLQETIALMSKDENLDGLPAAKKIEISPERAAEKIKGFAYHLGADLVGIGPLNPAWVYSHVGRAHYPGKQIGPEIQLSHPHAVVVAIHLDLEKLRSAPEFGTLVEIIKTYMHLAQVAVTLAKYIRLLGYSARAHDIHNYQIILPPVAIDAGLGELGRNGVLITEKYGTAVKLAAVTTDLPVIHDKPVDIGVEKFCQECQICAKYCPVGAISMTNEKKVVRGVRKWKINDNACYSYWRTIGTDCGICMSVCPWSRSRNFPHNLVQNAVERSTLARKLAVSLDSRIPRKRCANPGWLEDQPQDWKKNLRRGHPFA